MFKRSGYSHLINIIFFLLIICSPVLLYGEGEENLKKVAFIPFESSLAAGEDLAEQFRLHLALAMKEKKLYSPHRLEIWLNDKYGEVKAKNLDEIIKTMGEVGFDVLFVCHGNLFKVGNIYGIIISLHSLDNKINDSYYMRYFDLPRGNEKQIEVKLKEISNQIVDEISVRSVTTDKTHFNKTLFIDKFKIKLIQIDEIKATGTKIPTIIPIININGTEYKDTDHFFHELLLYKLHTTGLFSLKNYNMHRYIQDPAEISGDADYIVSGYLFIERSFNMLMIDIKNQKTKEIVQSYMYPFTEMIVDSLEIAMRKNSLLIGLAALETNEREKIGTAEILTNGKNKEIFCNNFFIGINDQTHLLLPAGQNNVQIGNMMYKMFVYPFSKNYQFWDIEDSIITQMISIVEKEKNQ
ncbi:MAG: hypothetical protein JXB88_04840 [Spirochaetales bacterium]|nr:hypothetical protein [Spirochaetales bacterium]